MVLPVNGQVQAKLERKKLLQEEEAKHTKAIIKELEDYKMREGDADSQRRKKLMALKEVCSLRDTFSLHCFLLQS